MARSAIALLLVLVLASATQLNAQAACNTSIFDAVAATPDLSLLGQVVQAAGLTETLSDPTLEVTVFAPNNAAFEELLQVLNSSGLTLDDVTAPESNKAASILLYHVVPVAALSTQLSDMQVLPTLLGKNLTVSLMGGMVNIIAQESNATVVTADVTVCGSVVHIINHVLIPAALADIPNYMPTTPTTPTTPPAAMTPPAAGSPPGTPPMLASPPPPDCKY
ncbi:hypothetical protein MPTK1_2g02510 [Marchantia polymorpha subsp. ruderalis]|uniref:FAS1 domain-containing protein n=1 Tax=Marchantia polymorpha TaxID=3197 RepID=A0A2R6WM07_MARPO|nr:hypothetical protein MARPO_0075s0013 [Marchantia polymorpha]BBN00833.1 hypothetical protein Mp_2g02510 [Marchantia polymorpha subsp. ruderalis]|eukprot:PTQ34886.1 hypothetical protein MARPO_0075s0013 [Marchantia polymorpha]